MVSKAIMAVLVAKDGMQEEVESFLRSAKPLVEGESGTVTWYAIKLNDTHYGIFDTFENETGRATHLHGKVAEALQKEAPRLFAETPMLPQDEKRISNDKCQDEQ